VHGIHITFPHPTTGRSLSATYLPDVIPEQGWTREEAVLSLIHKAGYRGYVAVGDALWNSIAMKVYGSVKAKASYAEYIAWAAERGIAPPDAAKAWS
jgi:AMMECR1 domain-containing protein